MTLPIRVPDTEALLGVDNGAIKSAIPIGIAPGANQIVYIDGVLGDGANGGPFSGGDFDYYSVYIAANSTITAALYGAQWGTGIDAKVDILDANGTSINSSDDYGSLDPLTSTFRSTGGIYIVRVSRFDNTQSNVFDSASGNGGSFDLLSYRLYIGTGVSNSGGMNVSPGSDTTMTGDANANIIDGGVGADIVNGGNGDDVLNGGYGSDTVTGGIGDDTFLWNINGSVQLDQYDLGSGGEEIVVVHSSLSSNDIQFVNNDTIVGGGGTLLLSGTTTASKYTVDIYGGTGIDTLVASGTSRPYLTRLFGGEGNDTLVGSGGSSMLLSGGGGNDVLVSTSTAPLNGLEMDGGEGDDTYQLGSTSVFIRDGIGQGTADRVVTAFSFGLINASFVEIEFLETANAAGTTAIDLTGNAFAQTITGNAGMNTLDGGTDSVVDTLIGLAGNDTYVLGASTNDVVTDSAGIDTITSTITRSLATYAGIENLTLAGASAIGATGSAGANTLTGNGAANRLEGGAGKDLLIGGLGDDRFVFRSLTDSAVGTARDTISDFTTAGTLERIDLSLFAGTFAFVGTGAFASAGKEVGYKFSGANTIVKIDVDGDTASELEILLVGHKVLTAADFYL